MIHFGHEAMYLATSKSQKPRQASSSSAGMESQSTMMKLHKGILKIFDFFSRNEPAGSSLQDRFSAPVGEELDGVCKSMGYSRNESGFYTLDGKEITLQHPQT